MDDMFEARASPWRNLLMLAGSLAFVAAGLWFVGAFGPDRPDGFLPVLIGWICIGFFGLTAVLSLRNVCDRSVQVRVDAHGIWSKRFSEKSVPWDEITTIAVLSTHGQKMLGFDLVDPDRYPKSRAMRLAATVNEKTTGLPMWVTVTGTDRSFDEFDRAVMRHSSKDTAPVTC